MLIDRITQRLNRAPLFFSVRFGDAGIFVNPGDAHVETEFDFAGIGRPGHWRSARRGRGASQGNMAFAGEQAGRWVQPDPAGAGDKHLSPGVQVGEIGRRAGGTVERLEIGGELNQIAGDEPRRQPQMPQDLHQQPGGVPTGAGAVGQGFFAALDAWLHADDVTNGLIQAEVDGDQKIDDPQRFAGDLNQPFAQQRPVFLNFQIRGQFLAQGQRVGKRVFLSVILDEKSKGLITVISAIKSTVTASLRIFRGTPAGPESCRTGLAAS